MSAPPEEALHRQPRHEMPAAEAAPDVARLRSYVTDSFYPDVPQKFIIEDHSLVDVFRRSASFQKIIVYLQACGEALWATGNSQRTCPADVAQCCPTVRFFAQELFPYLHRLVDEIPLEDMASQRFGNRAKRVFHAKLEEDVVEWMERLVRTLPSARYKAQAAPYFYTPHSHSPVATDDTQDTTAQDTGKGEENTQEAELELARDEAEVRRRAVEFAEYLKDSFGNATRLDYGTGHELHFALLLFFCLEDLGDAGGTLRESATILVPSPTNLAPPAAVPAALRPGVRDLRQQFMFYVFWPYMDFMRRLQTHYSLEPAGSHGVWGLDDYHHIPYIFGAAQLIGRELVNVPLPTNAHTTTTTNTTTTTTTTTTNTNSNSDGSNAAQAVSSAPAPAAPVSVPNTTCYTITPADMCDKRKAALFKDEYLFFSMIHWIYEHKSGPFAEHSNMLFNISGVVHWEKVYGGMIKMYAAEVLAKFNVSQHLLFGKHLPWNTNTL